MNRCFRKSSAHSLPSHPQVCARRVFLFAICSTICAAIAPLTAAAPTIAGLKKNPTLILQSADHNENTLSGGEFISVLRGNVVFSYDDITIRSNEATWWRNAGTVDFKNSIRINRQSQKLQCDKMSFNKARNTLTAQGNFRYSDTTDLYQLSGSDATYKIDTKFFTLTGDPKLVKFDSASAETLTITGHLMSYSDSLKEAMVKDSVKITKGSLFSSSNLVYYNTDLNRARLRIDPHVTFETHKLDGDSINLTFGKESLQRASVFGHAHGLYVDTANTIAGDSTLTHVWGDSLTMIVSDSGWLDSLWVRGKSISKHYTTLKPEKVDQAEGRVMLMSFNRGGNIDRVKIWGNARSTYFLEEQESSGINEASGDSITVVFRQGKAAFLNLAGSARGIYYPHDL